MYVLEHQQHFSVNLLLLQYNTEVQRIVNKPDIWKLSKKFCMWHPVGQAMSLLCYVKCSFMSQKY